MNAPTWDNTTAVADAVEPTWDETAPADQPTFENTREEIPPDPQPAKNVGDWLHKTFGGFHLQTSEEYDAEWHKQQLKGSASSQDIEHVKAALALAQKPLPGAKEAIHLGYQASPFRIIGNTFPNTDIGKAAAGVADGMEAIGTSLASPSNIAMLATGIGQGKFAMKAVSAIFFGMAASRFPTQLKQFNATNDWRTKTRLLTEMAAGLGLPLAGWKGGEKIYAKEPDAATSEIPTEQGESAVSQAESEIQAGDTRQAPTQEQVKTLVQQAGERFPGDPMRQYMHLGLTRNEAAELLDLRNRDSLSTEDWRRIEELESKFRPASTPDIRGAANRHKALLNEGQKLGAQAKIMQKMGVPIPATISNRLQEINTELRTGIQDDHQLPVRNEETGATTKPAEPSAFAPVDPPNTDPQVGKVGRAMKNFKNWWEDFWPRTWAVLRSQPQSWVITEYERLLTKPINFMRNFTRTDWYKGLRKLGDDEIVRQEALVVQKFRELKEAGDPDAWDKSVQLASPELQKYFIHRKARQDIENQAADDMEVPRPDFIDEPYLPRVTTKNFKDDVVSLVPGAKTAGYFQQLRRGIGAFDKSRVHSTMQDGISNGIEYESPLKAIWRREEFSTRMEATADMLRNLKQKGTLFKTLDEAQAANPKNSGGAPMKIEGFGGRDLWVRSRQEALSLEQNLSPRERNAMARLVHMANLFSRDPNFTNPLPHITKNMAFKYVLARVGNATLRKDILDFKSNAEMRARFDHVMPFAEGGQRMDQLRAWEAGNWAEKAMAMPGKFLGYSRNLIFEKADPAMRYSLWKSYKRTGMSDIEAANHVWIDLIRYNENSGGLNFWREIPFNFFATWRTGSFVTLAKQFKAHPIRTALFIGAVDYMREAIYRQTGLWTHLPHDYMEAPLWEMITGGPGKAATVALTAYIFGPGGGQAPTTIKQVVDLFQGDPGQWARFHNMFWGMSAIWNAPGEWKAYQKDHDISHLAKIFANAAFSTHSALKYEPRRFMKAMPDWMPFMEKSQTVKEAEALRKTVDEKQKKMKDTVERRHGLGAALEYTDEETQMQALRRAAGQRSGGRLIRPHRPARRRAPFTP